MISIVGWCVWLYFMYILVYSILFVTSGVLHFESLKFLQPYFPNVMDPVGFETYPTNKTSLIWDVSLLALFAIQHTIMARNAFKRLMNSILPQELERSLFVILSSLILHVMFLTWQPQTEVIWKVPESMTMLMWGLNAVGWIVVTLSTFMIDHFELLGVKQAMGKKEKAKFRTPGFYYFVRHPLMTGWIIAFWSAPVMTVGRLVFAAVATIYIFIGVLYFEEKQLLRTFPQTYKEYQQTTPAFFPNPFGSSGTVSHSSRKQK